MLFNGNKLVVLVVDDQPDNIMLAKMSLSFCGAEVYTAGDGKEGLRILASMPKPDVILLDLNMPRMNGYEMLKALKADSCYSAIPVVAFSAHVHEDDVPQLYQLGFNGYIGKPFDPLTLYTDLEKQINSIGKK